MPRSKFSRIIQVIYALAACAALVTLPLPPAARAQIADCETMSSGLAEPVSFTAPLASGDAVRVQALLRRPAGGHRSAAVVVVHGFWGIRPPRCYRRMTDRLTDWGYVTLLIDSPSQITRSGVQVAEYSTNEQAAHAQAGAAFVAALPEVDPERIGILGISTGGLSTIKAIAGAEAPIAAAAAFYPICPARTPRLRAPLLLLIAGKDSMVSAPACKAFKAADPADSIELVIYPEADHVFESPWSPAYDPAASDDAFGRLRRHFEAHLGSGED